MAETETSFTPATSRLVLFFLIPSIIGLYRGHIRLPALVELGAIQVSNTVAAAVVAVVAALAVYTMYGLHKQVLTPKVKAEAEAEAEAEAKAAMRMRQEARRDEERRDEAASAEGARRVREGEEEARHEEARLRAVAAAARRDAALVTANGAATAQAHCLTLRSRSP